jgi:phage terminase Nu1 subunit (DNA packaging protein)
MDIMTKFDQVILKNSDSAIQLISMKFLSMILERVKEALNILTNVPLACDKISAIEAYQQAILRVTYLIVFN